MTDKMGTKYAQNAKFFGRKPVSGPLNDFSLAHLVSDLQSEVQSKQTTEELRCNLEFSDKHLLITYIKKDEGFESDGESTKSTENPVKISVFNHNSDDSSSANSSASDSDDLNSKSNSTSASPTSDLAKYKFDHKESYNIQDVLICHTASNFVVWVIRDQNKDLEALVIQCSNDEEVKSLYKKFLDVSKKSKLERHRRRKSDGGSVVARSMEAIFKRDKSLDEIRYSLVQHTDRNGITHIEVEQPKSLMNEQQQKMGPSQQLVAKLRSSRSNAKKPSEKSKFAKELESILSKEIESRKALNVKVRPPGESLSLRQRAPALLLRKLDEFEEKANAMWAKAEEQEELNRKIWSKPTARTPPAIRAHGVNQSVNNKGINRSLAEHQRKERLSRIKAELLGEVRPVPNGVPPSEATSTQAPSQQPPAVVNNTPAVPQTPTVVKESQQQKKGDQILVPTKTGKEPVKKLYPKDVPEFMQRGIPNPTPRFMLAPIPTPMQFTAQPHSLPFYPVTVTPMTPHWGRFPSGDFNDTNNNMHGPWIPVPRTPNPDNGRGRSRDRGRVMIDPEQRRRAQSKSPARLQVQETSHHSSSSGGLTRKFREIGDAFRQRISRKSVNISQASSAHDESSVGLGGLKSNLKTKIDAESSNTTNDNKKVHFNKFATVQMMEWSWKSLCYPRPKKKEHEAKIQYFPFFDIPLLQNIFLEAFFHRNQFFENPYIQPVYFLPIFPCIFWEKINDQSWP